MLGALPDDERAAYVAHLETCAVCQAEVEELSVAGRARCRCRRRAMKPPPALKARIMAEVEREAALLASASEPRREPKTKRRWRFSWPMGAVALACVALLLGLGAGAALFGAGGTHGAVRARPVAAAGVGGAGDRRRQGGRWSPTASRRRRSGRVYMVWLVGPDGKPKPTSALFKPRGDGSATASVTGDWTTPRPWSSTPRSRPT